jgi:SusD family.
MFWGLILIFKKTEVKKKIYGLLIILVVFTFSACEKYTDITPKGKNLLNRVSDLDQLLNYDYSSSASSAFYFNEQATLINDFYPIYENLPNLITKGVKNRNYMLLTYDESINREELYETANSYEDLYSFIVNVPNIVLLNADEASGDQTLAQQLKAEAYLLRAYAHYLLVNIYAKAYDPETAEEDGGIPYVDDFNLEEINEKITVAEVYDRILDDINAAFSLDALPDQPKNSMRVGKGFAYAIKAWVMMSMRNYEDALSAANSALALNDVLEDHRPWLPIGVGDGQGMKISRTVLDAPDNYFHASYTAYGNYLMPTTDEIWNVYYETGNIIKDYTSAWSTFYGTIFSGIAIPTWGCFTYAGNTAGFTTTDMYLIKAECLTRANDYSGAMNIINYIRERRIYPYEALETPGNEAGVMTLFKKTARIEFLGSWKNFVNIKRWNTEGTYAETITRHISIPSREIDETYTLTPNSPLWIFPFPRSATQFNSTLTQNY